MKIPKLKRCPFCGGKATLAKCLGAYTVECLKGHCVVDVRTIEYATASAAADAWNERAPSPSRREK